MCILINSFTSSKVMGSTFEIKIREMINKQLLFDRNFLTSQNVPTFSYLSLCQTISHAVVDSHGNIEIRLWSFDQHEL
ncbi:unnamed protein product [Caenorhabditis nigoni]